ASEALQQALDHGRDIRAMPLTESEWLAANDPTQMLEFVRGKPNNRRLQLFVGACCIRSTKGYSIPEWDTELKTLVSLGNGEIEADEFQRRFFARLESVEDWALWRAQTAQRHVALKVVLNEAGQLDWPKIRSQGPDEGLAQCRILRDIFPNPF